jgi:hypothetical protein
LTVSAALLERTWLARPDLAEQGLEGIVRAAAYRPTTAMHACVAIADIERGPEPDSGRLDQLLFGEAFDVLERVGDRVWGRARRDGTVGWINRWALAGGAPLATHRVAVVDGVLPLNALVHHDFSGVPAADLKPIGEFETDPVAVAESLLGVAHALGARSSRLTDCSGLVQQALFACGRAGPRHSDEQAELGVAVDRADLKRGDLVVWLAEAGEDRWTGHSAFALDALTLIHATGHHGAVVVEPLVEAQVRYATGGFAAPVFRRLNA